MSNLPLLIPHDTPAMALHHLVDDDRLDTVQTAFATRVATAYNQMFADCLALVDDQDAIVDYELAETEKIKLVVHGDLGNDDKQDLYHTFRVITGRCGAQVGAAVKSSQFSLLTAYLLDQRDGAGRDITPAVAHALSRVVLPRGLSKTNLMKVFGQPGRTAADKSALNFNPEHARAYWPPGISPMADSMDEIVGQMRLYSSRVRADLAGQWIAQWEQRRRRRKAE